jgi:hypothetical protein
MINQAAAKEKLVFVITDAYKRVWHLPIQVVFDDWLVCEADYRNLKPKEMLALVKEGKAACDVETWMAEQMFADVLASKAILVKDLSDKEKIALAEKFMKPGHLDQIVDEHKIKWPSKAALKAFDKSITGGKNKS